jgi:hypothetical protein
LFCGIDNIQQNIPAFILNVGIFCRILSIPHNIVIYLNNVMVVADEPTYIISNLFT